MSPLAVFGLQFAWFLVAWSAIAALLVAPRLREVPVNVALSIWLAPHLFRALGLGLLVPKLSPGMPESFAVPTAIGDFATAVLALVCLVALQLGWRHARRLTWVFSVVGAADLLFALSQAVRVQAAQYLEAQWYVPALCVPLMMVTHVMVIRTLLTRRSIPAQKAR